ncbi:MAG: NfeD family protein [Hyphomonadaceae bacterium]
MNALADWFAHIDSTHWFTLAFVLLIAELAMRTTYLLGLGLAAGVTGLAALFFGWSLLAQGALFVVLAIALAAIARPLLGKWLY